MHVLSVKQTLEGLSQVCIFHEFYIILVLLPTLMCYGYLDVYCACDLLYLKLNGCIQLVVSFDVLVH